MQPSRDACNDVWYFWLRELAEAENDPYRPAQARIRPCCSCRNGGIDREADVYVTGTIVDTETRRRRPFRGYVCHDHADMLIDDGAKLHERPV
jgi:hypothetical protein